MHILRYPLLLATLLFMACGGASTPSSADHEQTTTQAEVSHSEEPADGASLVYDPTIDGAALIQQTVEQTKESKKHILIIVGGDWCPWCMKLHGVFTQEPEVAALLAEHYEVLHIYYGPQKKDMELMATLQNPHKLGFPALVMLAPDGTFMHTQETGAFEQDKGYVIERILNYLKEHAPKQ